MVGVSDIFGQFDFSFAFDDGLALDVLLLAIVLAIVSLFVWEFYKSTSKRNLIALDLRKYNVSKHPLFNKFIAVILYLFEYIIIMPFLIILWFAALSFVLLLIADPGTPIGQILLTSAVVIGAIRILAYFKGEIAKDLAKLFPFIALSVFLLTLGNLFDLDSLLTQALEIPLLLNNVFSYVIIISFIEIVLRIVYTVFEFWVSEGGEEEAIEEVVKEKVKEELENN